MRITAGKTCVLSYAGSDITDMFLNELAAFSGSAVTNNSGAVLGGDTWMYNMRWGRFGYRRT